MINQILSFIFQTIPGLVMGLAAENMFIIKKNAPPKWVRVGLWVLAFTIGNTPKILLLITPNAVDFFSIIVTILPAFLGSRFFYEGNFKYKVSAFILLFLAFTSAEPVNAILVSLFHLPIMSQDFTQPDMVFFSLIGCVASNVAVYIVALLWRRFKMKKNAARGSWLIIGMLFCLHFPVFAFMVDTYNKGNVISPLNIASMIFSIAFGLFLIIVQFNLSQKDEIEKELGELKHITELEHQHYESVETRREEMAKIRHDYNNILSSVLTLLHMKKIDEAEETVKGLLTKVLETREMAYCEIPIVNAILSEKEAECRKSNIKLNVDLLFPDDISVSHVELCSIFSNLLDNAIRACNRLPKESDKIIDLSVRTKGDYVLIRCDNPSLKLSTRPEGTGYGMKILKDISKRYSGEFKTSFTNGIFSAKLVLLSGVK